MCSFHRPLRLRHRLSLKYIVTYSMATPAKSMNFLFAAYENHPPWWRVIYVG
ncbi:hypothetical protein ENTCAN_08155 [Enterobacter cancerogenus ATCC 35316]|nr:hypothetical protein ENTCAN_08155 [Enterobacter cancerogenus ATCC 35316]